MRFTLKSDSRRTALIKKNIAASFLIKGGLVLVQLLSVPLTLHTLGVYENGIWLTISSMLLWIDNLDVGLGNGLRNKLAACLAVGDNIGARRAVSSTLAMLVIIVVPVAALLLLLIHFADTYTFLNVDSARVGTLDLVLSVSAVFVCSTFILKFVGNFYMGMQLPAVSNLLGMLGQTLALLGTLAVYLSGSRSMLLVAVANTVAPLLVYAVAFPVTFCRRYPALRPSLRYVDRESVRSLFGTGVQFFVLQISGLVLFQLTNLLISRYFTPAMVTPYQISYRYFSVVQLLFYIICMPFWTATTDAYNRGDYAWIRRSNRMLNRLVAGLAALTALMVVAAPVAFALWVGKGTEIPFDMTVIVALYVLILTVSMRYSYILNGFGFLRMQLVMTVSAAIVYIPLSVGVCRLTHDIRGLLLVMCLVNIPGLVVNYVQYRRVVTKRAAGIWLK